MNKLMTKVANFGSKVKFQTKQHSPEILFVAGTIGVVTSAVLACKATTKLSGIMEESKKAIADIHEAEHLEELKDKYTEKDVKKDLTITYVQTGIKIAKLYAGPVILGALSIASMAESNHILRKRNVQLAAACAIATESLNEYRKRVIEKFGEEVDKELRYGMKKVTVEETTTDEKGKEKKTQKTLDIADMGNYSQYAIVFEDSCYCEHHEDYDNMFLNAQQNYATDLLNARGTLVLNEVYDGLGAKVTDLQRKAGMVVGWKKERNNQYGDNRVLFDITHSYRELPDGTIQPITIIDFNVDGCIYDRMGDK